MSFGAGFKLGFWLLLTSETRGISTSNMQKDQIPFQRELAWLLMGEIGLEREATEVGLSPKRGMHHRGARSTDTTDGYTY